MMFVPFSCSFGFKLFNFSKILPKKQDFSTKSCHYCKIRPRLLSVLRKTLFRPSSHKRGVERFLSTASVQTCGIEELRVSKHGRNFVVKCGGTAW